MFHKTINLPYVLDLGDIVGESKLLKWVKMTGKFYEMFNESTLVCFHFRFCFIIYFNGKFSPSPFFPCIRPKHKLYLFFCFFNIIAQIWLPLHYCVV